MKLLKKEFVTLFIFVLFILMGSISFATYQSVVIEEQKNKEEIQKILTQTVELNKEEKETLELINQYRIQNGLEKLEPLASLQHVAKLKAVDIVKHNDFAHNSKNLGTPFEMLKENGISYKIAGENLAGSTTPEKAVTAWINSETHEANILTTDYEYTGICVIESPVYGKMFVQLFMGIN